MKQRIDAQGRTVVVHDNDGLYKRCEHPRRQWPKCRCPWHAGFQWHGVEHRTSLHKYASKPRDYGMGKLEAEGLRDHWRNDIRDGKWPRQVSEPVTMSAALTLADVLDEYEKKYLPFRQDGRRRREHAVENMRYQLAALRVAEVPGGHGTRVALAAKPIAAITKADVEAIRETRREQLVTAPDAAARVEAARAALKAWRRTRATRKAPRPAPPDPADVKLARLAHATRGGEVGTNRLLRRLRQMFNWAIAEGYVDASPFKRVGVPVVTLSAEKARSRRLEGDEERRLLDAAGPRLRALIVAALESGCRKGELLSLQWGDVHLDRGVIILTAEKTKAALERVVPITGRLRAVLQMRRHGPDGKELPADAYVFGNEVGEPAKDIKTARRATCRRAGIVGLTFHDLRRECGSRLLESPGVALHEVAAWLGHRNVTTTNTYLAAQIERLKATAKKFERKRRTFVAQEPKPAARPRTASHAPVAENRLN
jgi:integrase